MKLYGLCMLCLLFSLISGCASKTEQTPSLDSYQARTLPTGGSDAALAAHKTY